MMPRRESDAAGVVVSRSQVWRRWLKLLSQMAVTVGLLTIVLRRVDPARLGVAWEGAEGGFAALAGLAFLGTAATEVVRLRLVLRSFSLRWGQLVRLHLIGAFFGSFLPGQLGADLYKVACLRALGEGAIRPLALLALLRVSGIAVLLAAALVGLPFYGEVLHDGGLEWRSATASTAALVVVMGVVFGAVVAARPFARERLRLTASTWTRETRGALSTLGGGSRVGLLASTLCLLAMRMAVLYWLTAAVGARVGLTDALFVVVLATLVTVLPISFAGLGLREGTVVLLLTKLDTPYEKAVLVALLGRALIVLLSIIGGAWFLLRSSRPHLGRTPDGGRDAQHE